uniref:Uncharacterized protein n=1 Tax=Oncorhynchus tshawytscha TaxID=74940 RepID=A0AAZ3PKA6_ONCTS
MGSIRFWMCLVLTICTWNKTIGCTWMKTLPGSPCMFPSVHNNNSIFCLYFLASPVNNFKAEEQMAFISHTLKAIKKLYSSGKYESTAWDQKGVDKFMNDLYRQTSELDQCVKAMKTRPSKSFNRVNKKMSLHFKFLKHYLKREDYSASGREDIRTVVLAHLQRLDTTLSSQ